MDDIALLLQTPLFEGMSTPDLNAFLTALRPQYRRYPAGGTLLMAGSVVNEIGILLEGRAEAEKLTAAGRQFTVAQLVCGSIYGDILFGGAAHSPVSIRALCPCRALLLPYSRLFSPACEGTPAYTLFLKNLLRAISQKYFALDARVDLLLTRRLRSRIAAWLLYENARHPGDTLKSPLNRAALAAHLGCERSALSREISRMANEGLIWVNRSQFRLLDVKRLQAAAREDAGG